jgi:hypothetical protein
MKGGLQQQQTVSDNGDCDAEEEANNSLDRVPFLTSQPRRLSEPAQLLRPEDFVQSPIAKFRQQGKTPFKLLLNVAVLALLAAQMANEVALSRSDADEMRHVSRWLLGPVAPASRGHEGGGASFDVYRRGAALRAAAAVASRYHSAATEADFAMPTAELPVMTAVVSSRSFRTSPAEANCAAAATETVDIQVLPGDTAQSLLQRLYPSSLPGPNSRALLAAVCAPRQEVVPEFSDPHAAHWYSPCLQRAPDSLHSTWALEDSLCALVLSFRLRRSVTSSDAFRKTTYLFSPVMRCSRFGAGGFRCQVSIDALMQRSHARPALALLLLAALALCCGLDIALRVKAILKLRRFRTQSHIPPPLGGEGTRILAGTVGSESSVEGRRGPGNGADASSAYHRENWNKALLKDLGASWHYWAIVCHLCCVAYACLAAHEALEAELSAVTAATKRLVLGCACFTSALQFLGFLRFFPRVYFLIKATRRSMPRLLEMLACGVPLFVGSACFVTIVYGSDGINSSADGWGDFASFSSSATALFTATFGDSLLRAFGNTAGGVGHASGAWLRHALGGLFLVIYVFVFMSVILNVALAVVMDVFGELRESFGVALLHRSSADKDEDGAMGRKRRAARLVLEGLEELLEIATLEDEGDDSPRMRM